MSPWNLSLWHLLGHLRGCDFSMAGGQSIGPAPLTRLTTGSCITRPGALHWVLQGRVSFRPHVPGQVGIASPAQLRRLRVRRTVLPGVTQCCAIQCSHHGPS